MFEIKRKIFEILKKNERVLENVDFENVQRQKILRDHMGFFVLASYSSSPLVRSCSNFSGNFRGDFFPHLRSLGTS